MSMHSLDKDNIELWVSNYQVCYYWICIWIRSKRDLVLVYSGFGMHYDIWIGRQTVASEIEK